MATIGYSVLVYVAVFTALQVLSIKVVGLMTSVQKEYLKMKDSRLRETKSALRCLLFIAMSVLERVVALRLGQARVREVDLLVKSNVARSAISTLNWGSAHFSFVVMIVFMFYRDQPLEYSFVVPFAKMVTMMFYSAGYIPKAVETYYLMSTSLERIKKFIDLDDIEILERVRREESSKRGHFIGKNDEMGNAGEEGEGAVVLAQWGLSYTWKDVQRTGAGESSKRYKGGEGMIEMQAVDDGIMRLEDIRYEVCRKKMVVVIGKVGSGKSSLLKSIFNEMELLPSKSKGNYKHFGEEYMYISQSPWILNRSILENIIMDELFDEARLKEAIRIAQLDTDIEKMLEGVSKNAGKRGERLSGGQKARVALARSVYKE